MSIGAWLRYDSIRRGLAMAAPRSILEVGPGRGAVAARLAARYDYTAVELDPLCYRTTARVLTELGRGSVVHGTVDALPPDLTADLVCAFEVLEHIEDDTVALREWAGRLHQEGHVLLSVPSGPDRLGPWDEAVGHYRRYSRASLSTSFHQAGLQPIFIDEWGAGLGHGLEALRNIVARRRASAGSTAERTGRSGRSLQPGGALHGTLNAVVASPFRLAQLPLRSTDLGVGLVALARLR